MPGGRSSSRVVVVGAGPGGLAAVHRLLERAPGAVEVSLITRRALATHLAGTVPVALGARDPGEFEAEVGLAGTRVVAADVERVEAGGVIAGGEKLPADAVIAAPGLELAPGEVPAWSRARVAWDVRSAEAASADLAAVPGGRVIVGVCSLPYRCPPAPFSLAMQLAERYRRGGTFTKVCVTTPEPFPLASVGGEAPGFLLEACAGAEVEVERSFEPDLEASEDGVWRSRDGRELDYELAFLVPPHVRPVALAELPGDGPLVRIDERCATPIEGVLAAGDVTASGLPRAAGVAAAQGRTAADSALADLGLAPPVEPHSPRPSCYVGLAGGSFGRIRVTYPEGLPPRGEPRVEIDGPSPDLALAAEAERARFLRAARAS